MTANIIYRLSSFADYQDISYSTANMLKLIQSFSPLEMLPAAVQEILPDGSVSQRLQLSSADNSLVITILSTRIDVQITALKKEGFSDEDVDRIQIDLPKYLGIIQDAFSDIMQSANRLAWLVVYVIFDISADEKAAFRNKYLKELDFFKEGRTDDLLARYSTRKPAVICDRNETINALATLGQWVSNIGTDHEVDGYKVELDINTYQANKRNRFDKSAFGQFVSKSMELQRLMEKEFLK